MSRSPNPLLVPLILVMGGIVTGKALEFSLAEAAWPCAVFAALALLSSRVRAPLLTKLAGGLAVLFAGVAFEGRVPHASPPELDAGSREILLVEGCVVEPTVFSSDRAQFTLELEPGARARVSLPVDDPAAPLQTLDYGQRVEIEARLRKPHNFNNPGGFDYVQYLARRNIFWNAAMPRGSSARILPGACGSKFMAAVFALRGKILDRIESLFRGDDYDTGMMEAVLIGETSRLERIWTENFRRTGTFHALVISGVHITVLAGVLLFLLRLLPISQITALCLTAALAWLYALISGMSAPVVRAAGGFTLYILARVLFRRTRVLNLLAAVALVYLAWDPEELFDASFQLSFLAVATLGAIAIPWLEATTAPFAKGLGDISNRDIDPHLEPKVAQWHVEIRLAAEAVALWTRTPVRWVQVMLAGGLKAVLFSVELISVSLAVQIGLALPMAVYFHRVSFTSLSSNLLIVPAMNALVPAGFLAAFSGWHWVAAVSKGLLWFAGRVAGWHAAREPGIRLTDPPVWLVAGFTIAMLAVLIARHPIARITGVCALAGALVVMVQQPWPPETTPGTLELTAIDVGQGDSLLVVFPERRTMLVDGGGLLSYGRARPPDFDIGEEVVAPYLWNRRIQHLDVLVATHAHQDHIGGLGALLEDFRPGELWVGANPAPELMDHAKRLGIRVVEQAEKAPFPFSGATIEVLAPEPGRGPNRGNRPENNDSLAFRIAYGERSFLLTGDLERAEEGRLLAEERVKHSDVLKVGHHGSKTSSIEPFLDAVKPSVAVISAGFENSFGHPHPDVLGRLTDRHTTILRTDLAGISTVRTDGKRLWYDAWNGHTSASPIIAKLPIFKALLQ